MKKFIYRNEGFVCEVCGYENRPADSTCRNHCVRCLCSKHVDSNPGDRLANCGGIMRPIRVEIRSGVPYRVVHLCEKCGFERPNKILEDDSRERIFEISEGSVIR